MIDRIGGGGRVVPLTLYTDAFTIRGRLETRHRRITDALNEAADGFLVLADVTFDEYRSAASPMRAEFAQINLGSVLFVVSDEVIDPDPRLASARVQEIAMISIPPFRITGQIHLVPEQPLRESLGQLRGAFIPITDATHWSDPLGEARTTVALVAVNHARCQVLAPHREVDPWAGLSTGSPAGEVGSTDTPPSTEPTGW
jgi:hypothetical protein